MKTIVSRENALIKEIQKLEQHKYRRQSGLYLIEGRYLVEEALIAGESIRYVLVDLDRADQFQGLIDRYQELEWLGIDSRIMKSLCDTEQPQGIAAVLKQPVTQLDSLLKPGGFLVILDRIGDPGNLGTMIRTAWGFGADGVLLTPGCVDAFNPKVVRSTMGGLFHVPILEGFESRQVQGLKTSGYQVVGTSGIAVDTIYDTDFTTSTAVIIGSEAHGISAELTAWCDHLLRIPMQAGVNSLNAAVAGGIILNQVFRERNSGPLFV